MAREKGKNIKGIGAAPVLSRLRECWPIGAMLLLFGFAAGFHKTRWHGCGQQSSSDVASLLVFGIAAEDASRVEAAVARVGSGHRVTLVFWSITAGGG